jgi:hypothetical protein
VVTLSKFSLVGQVTFYAHVLALEEQLHPIPFYFKLRKDIFIAAGSGLFYA